jgi:hypothetical protein
MGTLFASITFGFFFACLPFLVIFLLLLFASSLKDSFPRNVEYLERMKAEKGLFGLSKWDQLIAMGFLILWVVGTFLMGIWFLGAGNKNTFCDPTNRQYVEDLNKRGVPGCIVGNVVRIYYKKNKYTGGQIAGRYCDFHQQIIIEDVLDTPGAGSVICRQVEYQDLN